MNRRLMETIGLLQGLQGLQGQQTQDAALRTRMAGESQQQGQQAEIHPYNLDMLKSQLAIQPLQQQRMQSELDYMPRERAMMEQRMKAAEMAGIGQIIEPLALTGQNPAVLEILKSRGILPPNFGQAVVSPEDEQMKQMLMQYIQQKGQR